MLKKKVPNRFAAALIVSVGLVSIALVSGFSLRAVWAQCITTLSAYRPFCSKPVSSVDGKKHITVNLAGGGEGTPNDTDMAAMAAALNEWNRHSDISGVVFELALAGTQADLEFAYTANETSSGTSGCAAYNSGSDRIFWGQNIRNRQATLGTGQVAAVFMHELGHYLGLNEGSTSPTTIMTQGENCQSVVTTPFVSEADAQKVADCAEAYCRQLAQPGGGGGEGGGGGGGGYEEPPCMDHWSPWGIYDNEGTLVGFYWEYSGCF